MGGETDEVCGPVCHQCIPEGSASHACPRIKEGPFGILGHGEHVNLWLAPDLSKVEKYGLV